VIRRTRIVHPLATLLQEFVEWRYMLGFRLAYFFTIGGVGSLLAAGDPVNTGIAWTFALLAFAAGSALLPASIKQEVEYRGKMSEVIAAVELYNADFEKKLADEAGSLRFYPQFKGVPIEEITRQMREEEPFAREQFNKHRKFILTFADKWSEAR